MRVVLFDGIQEMHVINSLERAFVRRGHQVLSTGKLTSGYAYIESFTDRKIVEEAIGKTVAFKPDLIIVFRPSALPPQLLRRLRKIDSKIYVWLSDDPVLWNHTYKYSIPEYDMILHCGGEDILSFYEKKFGYSTGINFPFWTDNESFRFEYGASTPETDLVFLGNASDAIRRQRYYDLAKLEPSIRIHGKIEPDYFNLGGGYLDNDTEMNFVGASSRIAINIPQYFADHHGQTTWFDGLDKLGFFEIPSRIVQYAAMGLPVISIEPKHDSGSSFQSVIRVRDISECNVRAKELLNNGNLPEISQNTHNEFQRLFTATSRVMAIESLMEQDNWKMLDPRERSVWFREFEAEPEKSNNKNYNRTLPNESIDIELLTNELDKVTEVAAVNGQKGNLILVVGERWNDKYSPATVFAEAVETLGHEIVRFNVFQNGKEFLKPDPSELFLGLIDIREFQKRNNLRLSHVVFVGDNFYLLNPAEISSMGQDLRVIYHSLNIVEPTERTRKCSGIADVLTVLNIDTVRRCLDDGIDNVLHCPDLVGLDFLVAAEKVQSNRRSVTILVQREGHLALYSEIIEPLLSLGAVTCIAEEYDKRQEERPLTEILACDLLVVLPDPSRPGNLPSKLLGHGFTMAKNVAVMRENGKNYYYPEAKNAFLFSTLRELALKYSRIPNDTRLVTSCDPTVNDYYSAQSNIENILSYTG